MVKRLLLCMLLSFVCVAGFAEESGWVGGGCTVGNGTLRFEDGGHYVGQCKDDKQHGVGTLHTENFRYEGEWRNGEMHGRATIHYTDGTRFEGQFERNKMSRGTAHRPDGVRITAEYVDGVMNGPANIHFPDGRLLEGAYNDGKQHGHATLYDPQGAVIQYILYANGQPIATSTGGCGSQYPEDFPCLERGFPQKPHDPIPGTGMGPIPTIIYALQQHKSLYDDVVKAAVELGWDVEREEIGDEPGGNRYRASFTRLGRKVSISVYEEKGNSILVVMPFVDDTN